MHHGVTRDEVIEEVQLVPDDKVPELFDVVRGFRVGCRRKSKAGIMGLAGSWAAFSDGEFQEFLDEVADRRARAFSARARQ